jgi:hypothetical protein
MEHCPESGKIYILIIFSIIFTGILTTINVLSKTGTSYQIIDDNLFGTGVAINVVQTIFTLYLIWIDLFGKCNGGSKSTEVPVCGNNCRWNHFDKSIRFVKYGVILLSSAYMLGFGIINIFQRNDLNTEQDITVVSMASFIAGVVGMLYIFSDIVCSLGCGF